MLLKFNTASESLKIIRENRYLSIIDRVFGHLIPLDLFLASENILSLITSTTCIVLMRVMLQNINCNTKL